MHNNASVSRLSLSFPSQTTLSRGSEALSLSPEHLISQHNIPQTHISTEATTTPQNERFWQELHSIPEIPPPPFDITKLWDLDRVSSHAELTDPSCISSMISVPGPPSITVSDIQQESVTLEEVLNNLLQAPITLHSSGKPNSATKLPSDEEAQRIAGSWNRQDRLSALDFFLKLRDNLVPSDITNDGSPAEPSRRSSNAHKSPEDDYMAPKILGTIQIDTPSNTQGGVHEPEVNSSGGSLRKVQSPHSEIVEDKPEHPFRSQLVIAQSTSKLYLNCFAGSGNQKKNPELSETFSMWFGLSPRQSLSDTPTRYIGEFLHQTPGLFSDHDFFAGFLCVKVGTDSILAMRNSWACQAKNVLLSHASLRRCNTNESENDKIAFVRSLKFFGYIVHDSEVEMWQMTVAAPRTSKHLKLSTSQSSSRRPETPSNSQSGIPKLVKAVSEPAPNSHPNNASGLLIRAPLPVKALPRSKPEPDQSAKYSHSKMFLANYLGTQQLDTGKGVQNFIKFHIMLMTWVRNGGYRPYVATVHEQLWYSDSLQDTQADQGLRLIMSESETMDFLNMAKQRMEQEEV